MASSSIECLIEEIKVAFFSPTSDVLSSLLLPTSAYDTAWVAMVSDPDHHHRQPMFPQCLDWILCNQRSGPDGGFWGTSDRPTMHCLASTLACILALKIWNVGAENIEQGLSFLRSNMEKLLRNGRVEQSFVIILPGMIDLLQAQGLQLFPENAYTEVVNELFLQRDRILETYISGRQDYLQLGLYLEALPACFNKKQDLIVTLKMQLEESQFRSPSTVACAFMITGDQDYINYLKTVTSSCKDGAIPPMYLVDRDFIKLCLVDHLERLGLGEHFTAEISDATKNAYRSWVKGEHDLTKDDKSLQIYKDSLTFRLLRLHGYPVSPRRLCWFVHDQEMLSHIEENFGRYLGSMYELYKASHLIFPEEEDLEKAKDFSRKILHKSLLCGRSSGEAEIFHNLQSKIDRELKFPWLARMSHLEYRSYIEGSRGYDIWLGKATFCSLSFPDIVGELSKKNFMLRQSVYRDELEEMKRWSKDTGFSDMGFGREKTAYCYFLAASATCLPLTSELRKVLAKCGILVTVADDFFDEKGSMDELSSLTNAVLRWEGKALSGHAKVIFDVLDELVIDISLKSFEQQDGGVKIGLQVMWRELFDAWLKESIWSRSRHTPTIKEYLDVGTVSIGMQAITIPFFYMMYSSKVSDCFLSMGNNVITKLLNLSCRLLNDIQSYQKEVEDGKLNMVLLYLKQDREAEVEDSINYINNMLNMNEKVLLELILKDDCVDMPKEWKELHLIALKVFHMLYNSGNAYDSPTALLSDISKAIYDPIEVEDLNYIFHGASKNSLKGRNAYQFKRNGSGNGLQMHHKSFPGFNYSIPRYSRAMKFGINQSLPRTRSEGLTSLSYQYSSTISALSSISLKSPFSVHALLFM